MREYLESASLDAHETISVMVGDLQRVRDYPKQGFQIEQDIPDDVWLAYEELVARGYDSHILK